MPIRETLAHLRLAGICLLLGGCQGVDLVFNEQVVYTDADLYTDYTIGDPGLRGCVERAILDGRFTAASQLRSLHCIEAGVVSLDGLAGFPNLERLDLTGNYDLPCTETERLKTVTRVILPDQCR